jgi:SAM-dependent methyltransferase
MTEMESSHFASDLLTAQADLHLTQERQRRAELDAYISAAVRFAPSGKWLDIGCGTGTFMTRVRARGIDVEGIELTKDRREVAVRQTGGPVYDAPLEALRLPRHSFAVVSLINVFSHLTDPAETIAAIRDVLMPGGVMLLRTAEIGPGVQKRHAFSWDLGDHLYFLGERTVERYANKAGFELLLREAHWMPAMVYTRERFLLKGRSRLRNAIKRMIAVTPGAMPLLRWYMLTRRDADNPVYSSTLILRKSAPAHYSGNCAK